jgi:broad specificity phosphatase PhoE
MAELYLIRHAQASFGTADYDRLSPLGCRQAKALAEYFRDYAIHFDAVYSGELERQRKTANIVLGLQPDNVHHEIDPRLNEIEIDKVFEHLVPQLVETSSNLENFVKEGEHSSKDYQKALEIVFKHWVTSDKDYPNLQSWAEYSGNVHRALAEIVANEGSGKNVGVFTSGGTIATVVAHVLGVTGERVYKFYEPLFNCSVTRILYSGNKMSLSSFNDHLFIQSLASKSGKALLTYR